MAVLVSCHHCGAPHRAVSSRIQFVCDYCQGLNSIETTQRLEELVVPRQPDPSRARAAAKRRLAKLGLPHARIELEEGCFLPIWHLVSAKGEELLLPAGMLDHSSVKSLHLPAVPMVPKHDPAAQRVGDLPAPEISRDDAEGAALASFEGNEPELERVRLLWLPVIPLKVHTKGGVAEGLFLEGAEKLVLAAIPDTAFDEGLGRERAVAVALYWISCLVAGMLIGEPVLRGIVMLALAGAAFLALRRPEPSLDGRRRAS